jgi:Uma2 family endonuclease
MPATTKRWTAEEVRALPDDGKRYELIDGELLVTPAPAVVHQGAVLALAIILNPYVRVHRLGRVFISPADIELEPDTIVQPDVFVVPPEALRRPLEWANIHSLLLAAEVLSPGTARYDRVKKRHFFQRHQVSEYWIVDLDARVVECWRPGDERAEVLEKTLVWHPTGAAEPLTIDLVHYFADVLHDEEPTAPDSPRV